MTLPRNLAYRTIDSLMVVIHSRNETGDSEWESYLQAIVRHQDRVGSRCRMLALALGGVANAVQRAQLAHVLERGPMRVALLTSSPLVRGLVVAMSAFNPNMGCFAPGQLRDALCHLQDPTAQNPRRVQEALVALSFELGLPSATVPEMRM